MALKKFTDAAGREAYLDTSTNMVFTEGGQNPTYYNLDQWNERQAKKYGTAPTDPISMVNEAAKRIAKEEKKFTQDYLKKNPFAFDENLARQSSTAEYDPYYTEILNDYISDIEVKRTSVQDQQQLSQKMKAYDIGARTREYANAVSKTEEGYAGNGLYFSGAKERDLGQMEINQQDQMGALTEKYGYNERNLSQQLTSLNTDIERKTRDIGREKTAAIESGILQRQDEAQKAYYQPLISSYYRRFPSSSGSVLAGYLPQEYLRY